MIETYSEGFELHSVSPLDLEDSIGLNQPRLKDNGMLNVELEWEKLLTDFDNENNFIFSFRSVDSILSLNTSPLT